MLGPRFVHTKNYFAETIRNKTLFFKKRNETERCIFWNRNRKPKRNKKKIQKRKRTKRKKNNVFEPQELQLSFDEGLVDVLWI
jgi:hypothetical protein